jgi:phage terminase small subunit
MGKLNPKQTLFCQEYLVDLNATQAAIRAGYSKKTAQRMGSENLSKPLIAEFIQLSMDKRSKKVEINAEWVLTQAVEMFGVCKELGETNTAKGYLELAGKHCTINAFKDITDHTSSDGSMTPSKITRVVVDES